MLITIPKDEKAQQLRHLNSLEPKDKTEFDEITVLLNLVVEDCKPIANHLKLVKVGG